MTDLKAEITIPDVEQAVDRKGEAIDVEKLVEWFEDVSNEDLGIYEVDVESNVTLEEEEDDE